MVRAEHVGSEGFLLSKAVPQLCYLLQSLHSSKNISFLLKDVEELKDLRVILLLVTPLLSYMEAIKAKLVFGEKSFIKRNEI